jgi:branched-chain amino acid transport system ATP-binding protein
MLKMESVTAGYTGVPVLRQLSIDVSAGSITALVGSNGAGKSTTMKAIVNAVSIYDGHITLNGESLANLGTNDVAAKGISLVPEGRRIFAGLTVIENLRVGAFRQRDKGQVNALIDSIFELFPRLAERRRSMGTALSGGEQQMLAIGRALMSSPQILLLDEPSMGLAPMMTEQVFKAVDVLRQRGSTILLVEQNARLALAIADHAYVLENGRIVMSGPGEELLGKSEIINAYLGGV